MYMYTQHILFLMSSTILAVNVSPVNTMRGQSLARVTYIGLCLSGKQQREQRKCRIEECVFLGFAGTVRCLTDTCSPHSRSADFFFFFALCSYQLVGSNLQNRKNI